MPGWRVPLVLGVLSLGLMTGTGRAQVPEHSHPLVVGYFPQWRLYDETPYLIHNLVKSGAAAKLDQLNYAQGFVTNGRCSIADPHADTDLLYSAAQSVDGKADQPDQALRGGFNQVRKLKQRFPHLKVLLSLEGRASDFADDAQPEKRQAFVASCINLFLAGHVAPDVELERLFDGIDLDWEYPGVEENDNFVALLAEFRKQMNACRPGMLLTVAVGPNPQMAGGYDLKAMAALVDEVGLMTYDMAGPWSQRTGFLAPLIGPDGKTGGAAGVVNAFLAAGIPASKLLMGVPFYGYAWKNVTDEGEGLFQEGDGLRGDHPDSEISGLEGHFTLHRDTISGSPWLFDGDQFWTFDDAQSIKAKAAWAREHALGGMMAWELGGDTADAVLINAMHDGLRAKGTVAPQ